MEENKVAQISKHTDTSRSTDSGVSGNAQMGARDSRVCESCDKEIFDNGINYQHVEGGVFCRNKEGRHRMAYPVQAGAKPAATGQTDSEKHQACASCSRLASRVEELEKELETVYKLLRKASDGGQQDRCLYCNSPSPRTPCAACRKREKPWEHLRRRG